MSSVDRQSSTDEETLAQVLGRDAAPFGDLTGQTLGDFQVERLLGRGGMGEVYLATQISLNRPVALKVLRPDVLAKPGYRQRFEAEALAVAKLNHPSIVHVYAMGQMDRIHYIAMEYVEGTNLREYIVKRGALDLAQALSIMKQAGQAIGAAGEAGIIHRDVKPENILITRRGRVKVADFGLCRHMDDEGPHVTQVGITMGTPAYMSPEQAQGYPLDHRSDLYSLGATCYYMLAGVPPFKADSPVAMALKQVREIPSSLLVHRPDLPLEIDRLVMKLMAKDPADRYQSAAEMLADLPKVRGAVQVSSAGQSGGADTLNGAAATMRTEELGAPAAYQPPALRSPEPSVPAVVRRKRPAPPVVAAPEAAGPSAPREPVRLRVNGLVATVAVLLGAGAGALAGWANRSPDIQSLASDASRRPPCLWIEPRWSEIPKQDSPDDQLRYALFSAAPDDWVAAWLAVPGRHSRSHDAVSKAYAQLARLWYRRDDVDALAALAAELPAWKDAQKRDKDLATLIHLALDLKKGDLGAVEKGFQKLTEADVADMYEASLVALNLEVCWDALQVMQKSGTPTIAGPLHTALRRLLWHLYQLEIGGPAGPVRVNSGAAAVPRPRR
jgi:eukaryotic-like serine/threonine-protein kinase